MSKYVEFKKIASKPKTDVYNVNSKSRGYCLGVIKWYAPWRQYCFFTVAEDDIFSRGCMRDIFEFIDGLMEARKK